MNKIRKIITFFKIKFSRKPRIIDFEILDFEDENGKPMLIIKELEGDTDD